MAPVPRGSANPTASSRGTGAINGAHQKLSKSEQEAIEFRALTRQLLDGNLPHAKRMVVIQQLNENFLQAQSLDKCTETVLQLPKEVFPVIFDLVSSGEPHVYLALHLLHFACFAPQHRATLLEFEALPFLLGLARSKAEYELSRAALSLMVTLAAHREGSAALGRARGVAGCVAGLVHAPQAEVRGLALELLRALLAHPAGRAQVLANAKLLAALHQTPQPEHLTEEDIKRLSMIRREVEFYEKNAALRNAQVVDQAVVET
mmetsp:Transcript_31320/g.68445  ORF Transcript_31320/g.68445 Transcript_31320/m.68445 type:complete len:262 (-) Transcript_31320:1746-2531(-)